MIGSCGEVWIGLISDKSYSVSTGRQMKTIQDKNTDTDKVQIPIDWKLWGSLDWIDIRQI